MVQAGVEEEDTSLVRRTLEKEFSAYEALFERYRGKVFSIAYYFTGNREDAEDVCQEVFLRLPDKLRLYDSRYPFGAWLGTVSANEARSYIRKQARRPHAPGEEIDFSRVPGESVAFRSEGAGGQPEKEALDEERLNALADAIRELPDRLRTVLLLHDISGFRYEETAGALGLPVGTVKSRLSRARIALGGILVDDRNPHRDLFLEDSA